MRNGFKVIDADAHMQDEMAHWLEFVEPDFWDRKPRVRIAEDRFGGMGAPQQIEVLPCELFPLGQPRRRNIQGAGGSGRRGRQDMTEFMPEKYKGACQDGWSAESRLRDMERYGWDKQVALQGSTLGWDRLQGRDQGLLWAMSRAYNNWSRAFCDTDPKRLYPVCVLPDQHDIEGLVTETRRSVERLGAVTVMMPKGTKERPWEHPDYDPFWRLAEELDVPIAWHTTESGDPMAAARYLPRDQVPGQQVALAHAVSHPFESMLSMGHLIYMGILERFPKMRVSFLENNAGWLPWWLSRLDDHALENRRQGMWFDAALLPLAPSEYFRRQGFVACDSDEGALAGPINAGWEDHIIWNTDYPHPDAPDPDKAIDTFLAQPISDEAKRKILWDNPVRLHGARIL
jgi:predicted TIM-barrel fold metal-dependent hydrolase